IGWHLNGFAGAALATLGIFAPSFVFAAFVDSVVGWSQRSSMFAAFLRGVSSGSIALMAVVMWRLADEALVDAWAIAVFVAALTVLRARAARRWWSARR
ncbi:MAG: chromate transporter, partial [Actinomycetota bacterium]